MLKRIILFGLISIFAIFCLPAKAQDKNPIIEYGKTVSGKITNKSFEVPFDFTAKKGEVFIIEMNSADSSAFASPEIIVLNSDGDVQGDSTGTFGYGSAFFVGAMTKDETITILATRHDGRSGDGTGDFTLNITKPETLKAGVPLQDSDTNKGTKYYLINKSKADMNLTYRKSSGDFSPEVSLNTINDSFGLTSLFSLQGKYLTNAQAQLPDTQGIYIVKVAEAAFDLYFNEAKVTYELQIDEIKQ
jgi:hypothetical protein